MNVSREGHRNICMKSTRNYFSAQGIMSNALTVHIYNT